MGVADLTSREAVIAAIEECRSLGETAFLERYGFGPSRDFVLMHEGGEYPSKAIVGAAHGVQHPDVGPLASNSFNGGRQTTDRLEALGFTIRQLSSGPTPRVFTVRVGKNGETEDFCLEEGWCGVGWDDMGDLSILSDEDIDREMDVAYADTPSDTLGQWKFAIKEFNRILQGDLILMPLKQRWGFVAVGEVIGPYERRDDFHELARHVYKTRWLRTDIPRELIGDFKRWMDRPPTASEIPVDDAATHVRNMLSGGRPISLNREGSLRAVLSAVLAELQGESPAIVTISKLVNQQGPSALTAIAGNEWPTSGGAGVGTPAVVPWFGLYPKRTKASAQGGFYLVYLFAADGCAAYLSLNQGTEKVQGGLTPLVKRALDLRYAAALPAEGDDIDLKSSVLRPRKYEAGNAFAIRYDAADLPPEKTLEKDLQDMLVALENAAASGLDFDPEIEPIHLLFKWSVDIEPQTVEIHRVLAEEQGSAWWCRYGQGSAAISPKRLEQLRTQVERGIATYAFLLGGGQLVRTRLHQLEVDPDAVDSERLAEYHDKTVSNLFARVSNFEDLPQGWAQTHLLPAKNADPATLAGALGNRLKPPIRL